MSNNGVNRRLRTPLGPEALGPSSCALDGVLLLRHDPTDPLFLEICCCRILPYQGISNVGGRPAFHKGSKGLSRRATLFRRPWTPQYAPQYINRDTSELP